MATISERNDGKKAGALLAISERNDGKKAGALLSAMSSNDRKKVLEVLLSQEPLAVLDAVVTVLERTRMG